jgi:hypothetical protein
MEKQVAWAPLKTPARTIDKVHRVYDGEVSRVLDVCRQRIVFDTVDDMITCVHAVLADPQVVIERVKNRLTSRYDAATSAGYRCIQANKACYLLTCNSMPVCIWV